MDRFWGIFVQTAAAIGAAVAVYWWVLSKLNIPELATVKQMVLRRISPTAGAQSLRSLGPEPQTVYERNN